MAQSRQQQKAMFAKRHGVKPSDVILGDEKNFPIQLTQLEKKQYIAFKSPSGITIIDKKKNPTSILPKKVHNR